MGEFARSLSDPASLLSMAVAVAMFMTVVGVMLPALKGDKLETPPQTSIIPAREIIAAPAAHHSSKLD